MNYLLKTKNKQKNPIIYSMHLPWRIFHQNKHKWLQSGIKHASTFPVLKIQDQRNTLFMVLTLWYKYATFSKTPLNDRTASLFWYFSWQRSSMWRRREKTKLQQIGICKSNFLCSFPSLTPCVCWFGEIWYSCSLIASNMAMNRDLVIAPILRNKLRDHFWHICQCFIYSSLLCHYFIYGIKYIKRL